MACTAAANKMCQIIYPPSTPCTANCGSTGMDFNTAVAIDYTWYALCQVDLGVLLGSVTDALAGIVGSTELAKTLIGQGKQFVSPCGYVGTQILAQTYAQYGVPNPPKLP